MRLPAPPEKYDQRDQAEMRRIIERFLANGNEIPVGGGTMYEDESGALMFRSRAGTITEVAPV